MVVEWGRCTFRDTATWDDDEQVHIYTLAGGFGRDMCTTTCAQGIHIMMDHGHSLVQEGVNTH